MNEFTKQELILLACWSVNRCKQIGEDNAEDEGTIALSHKIQNMIVNYCEHENLETVGTGQLLFHDKESASAIISKINKQLHVCENTNNEKLFRIDWKIIFGKKYFG